MSKKSNSNTTPAAEPATPAAEPETQAETPTETPTETPAEGAATALATNVVPESSLVRDPSRDYPVELDKRIEFDPQGPHAAKILLNLFPNEARALGSFRPVGDEELARMILGLPDALRQNLQDALDRMNPDMLGMHGMAKKGLRLFDVRIYHGTGKTAPKGTPPGGIFTTDGRIVATNDADMAAALKVPERFRAYVIANFKGRTLWPANEDDDDGANKVRMPICTSYDQEKGDRYGLCAACPHRPFISEHEKGDCRNEMTFFLVPEDFSGILRWQFSKSGMETARAILKEMGKGWRAQWEKPFLFTTREEAGPKDSRYFVAVPSPVNQPTPPAIAAALRVLARKIDTEVYWPALRAVHLRAMYPELRIRRNDEPAEPTKKTDGAGLAALAGLGGAKQLPDLSGSAPAGGRKNV